MGSPREEGICREWAASPTTASIGASMPQPRSSAGSLAAPIAAAGTIMSGMLPCWYFW